MTEVSHSEIARHLGLMASVFATLGNDKASDGFVKIRTDYEQFAATPGRTANELWANEQASLIVSKLAIKSIEAKYGEEGLKVYIRAARIEFPEAYAETMSDYSAAENAAIEAKLADGASDPDMEALRS